MFSCGTAPKIGKRSLYLFSGRTAGAEGVSVAPDRTEHDSSSDSTVLLRE